MNHLDKIFERSNWISDGELFGWSMPEASWWKRLPVIRHIRTIWNKIHVERHYAHGLGTLGIRTGYDDWILYGMWHGLERPKRR